MSAAPLLKRLASYLFEIHIESMPSEINPHLYVSLVKGKYQLSAASAIYSHGIYYQNFGEAFKQLKLDNLPGSNVLILGFGLGSIPILLEQQEQKKYHYTGVEIDECVLALAQKYTMHEVQSPTEMVCADAKVFVKICQQQFDMICVDVFLDDIIPGEFQQIEFLQDCAKLLSHNGLLLYNCLTWTDKDLEETEKFYNNVFSKAFPKAKHLEIFGNWILINDTSFLK